MKRILTALLFSLLGCSVADAEITEKQTANYIIKGNNITMCYFPEIWSASSQEERTKILQNWVDDPDKSHLALIYDSLYYPLLVDSFGEENAERVMKRELDLSPYLAKISTEKKNKTTVKTNKDCQALWEEVKHLITTYHYYEVSAE
ncbi:hypothetical protein BKK47_02795 [Rodentibacter mrazii]|uniref:Uncharacterized protein n=1 Tax=Rodentibacter mrazii TaxID=1908257 RepID=A0A1V3IJ37_9PAST|nr:hypothetical protein [Rodentibacter mrazii]OOF40851.1 hypothetical protein BKK47_02795 [Rodentibacter mrazii]